MTQAVPLPESGTAVAHKSLIGTLLRLIPQDLCKLYGRCKSLESNKNLQASLNTLQHTTSVKNMAPVASDTFHHRRESMLVFTGEGSQQNRKSSKRAPNLKCMHKAVKWHGIDRQASRQRVQRVERLVFGTSVRTRAPPRTPCRRRHHIEPATPPTTRSRKLTTDKNEPLHSTHNNCEVHFQTDERNTETSRCDCQGRQSQTEFCTLPRAYEACVLAYVTLSPDNECTCMQKKRYSGKSNAYLGTVTTDHPSFRSPGGRILTNPFVAEHCTPLHHKHRHADLLTLLIC